jgi:TetR/AcrR family transcriptional regulator, mexCD-oprJ operon repressor
VATAAPHPGGLVAGRQDGYHRQIADRNAEAILDAVDDLLRQHRQASIAAVAARAGVSRVTVYAHYPTSQSLLEAAVERAVRRVSAALESASPGSGPPVTALERTITLAWQHLASYGAMARAVSEQLSPEAVARTHHAAHQMIGALLERGQADGAFRTDLPESWLVSACIALVHACADAVRAGLIAEQDAPAILATSVRDLFTGPGR